MSSEQKLPYRPCVGIALFNNENKVFVGERLDSPDSWQMPQGGIDPGETVEDAFFRELEEELGTSQAEIIRVLEEPLCYDLPYHLVGKFWGGKYCGQEQTWVAARFTGADDDINIYAYRWPEFQKWQWVDPYDAVDIIVPFKRETYKQVIEAFQDIIKG